MERLGESSSKKKHPNALKAEEESSEASSEDSEGIEDSENEEAMLSRRLQRILAKKKKFQFGRRFFKRNKEFRKPEGNDLKKGEPICYECKKPGHIKAECPKLKKDGHKKKDNFRRFKKYKKKTMAAAWENSSDSDSESSSSSDKEEANLAFMANIDDKERFTFVKSKLCGNKAVDIADLEKNDMHNIVAAVSRMQWTVISTFSEVSYPDLVKAFYVCLKSVADGSRTSLVKETPIKIDHDLLKTLFGVSTTGHSGIHTVDTQILVPRSATFSTCTKADSDMMFWAVQNKEINMAEVMMERMKFAHDQIWDTKSKLNVSLPYAHLLTKVFKHFGVNVSGAVVEKMGQAIRSKNLRKSGFSVVNGVWTKTSVAEGEPIIGEAQDVQLEAAAVESEGPSAVAELATEEAAVSRVSQEVAADIEDSMETPVAQGDVAVEDSDRRPEDPLPTSTVASVLREVLDSIHSTPVIPETGGSLVEEVVASGHLEESVTDAPIQKESSIVLEDIVMEDAPIQGEQEIEEEAAASQGEQWTDAPENARPNTVYTEDPKPVEKRSKKIAHRRQMKIPKKMNLKPILKRLDEQGEILRLVQSDVSSVIVRQESMSNDISQIRNAMKWFNKEMGTMKMMVSKILKAVGSTDSTPHPSVPQSTTRDVPRPSGPSLQECGPPGQSEGISGPSGPIVVDQAEQPSGTSVDAPAGPSGPSIAALFSENLPILDADVSKGTESSGPEIAAGKQSAEVVGPPEHSVVEPPGLVISEAGQQDVAESAVAPEAPESSFLATPAPSSPPSSSTAPPAPPTFKQPLPRTISSPTPFPSQSSLSPTSFPIHPLSSSITKDPPASSSAGASSSSGHSSTFDPRSLLYPPTPPTSITFIPENTQLGSALLTQAEDEFERSTLTSILAVAMMSFSDTTGWESKIPNRDRIGVPFAPTRPGGFK
ncbi:hypothetical protein Taro_045641 [Colocasia esculenta]|uniref:CCHC-type domain-containing protein n=1 Tax=Colocasia esculenta TaxID=4460 RepID=A0A843WQ07_COLES|nr:hypothetical protein [Colocasia esculenta]